MLASQSCRRSETSEEEVLKGSSSPVSKIVSCHGATGEKQSHAETPTVSLPSLLALQVEPRGRIEA